MFLQRCENVFITLSPFHDLAKRVYKACWVIICTIETVSVRFMVTIGAYCSDKAVYSLIEGVGHEVSSGSLI